MAAADRHPAGAHSPPPSSANFASQIPTVYLPSSYGTVHPDDGSAARPRLDIRRRRGEARGVDPRTLGKTLVVAGLVAVVVGLMVWGGLLSWFGRLPGDVRIEGERTRVYVPITSMLLVSAAVSLVLWVLRKLGG